MRTDRKELFAPWLRRDVVLDKLQALDHRVRSTTVQEGDGSGKVRRCSLPIEIGWVSVEVYIKAVVVVSTFDRVVSNARDKSCTPSRSPGPD